MGYVYLMIDTKNEFYKIGIQILQHWEKMMNNPRLNLSFLKCQTRIALSWRGIMTNTHKRKEANGFNLIEEVKIKLRW